MKEWFEGVGAVVGILLMILMIISLVTMVFAIWWRFVLAPIINGILGA